MISSMPMEWKAGKVSAMVMILMPENWTTIFAPVPLRLFCFLLAQNMSSRSPTTGSLMIGTDPLQLMKELMSLISKQIILMTTANWKQPSMMKLLSGVQRISLCQPLGSAILDIFLFTYSRECRLFFIDLQRIIPTNMLPLKEATSLILMWAPAWQSFILCRTSKSCLSFLSTMRLTMLITSAIADMIV